MMPARDSSEISAAQPEVAAQPQCDVPIPISASDPRLDDYRRLTDVALRQRQEPAHGLFIAEGEWVVRRAVAGGYQVRSMLLLDRYVADLEPLAGGAPVFTGPPDVLAAITGFDVHRGVLAAMGRRPLAEPAALLSASHRLLILEDVNNPTNAGAVFRCAAALGIDAVLLSPRCADPLYRRAVRVSMGAVLAVPYARLPDWPAQLADVRRAGYRLLALTPDPTARPLTAPPSAQERVALLLGAEGPGLTALARAQADLAVRIPMAAGVESLNVAAAAAIGCFLVGRPPDPR
jgi:tRNA G18 (ribose-2'-O)-methylase SpoU